MSKGLDYSKLRHHGKPTMDLRAENKFFKNENLRFVMAKAERLKIKKGKKK